MVKDGARSESAILKEFDALSFTLEGYDDVISFDIMPEYVLEVISDLHKAEILTGKDGKIKTL